MSIFFLDYRKDLSMSRPGIRDPLSYNKGRARIVHVKYNRVAELTAPDVVSDGVLSFASNTDASLRSTGGRVRFLSPVTLSGVARPLSLSDIRASSKTIAVNYADQADAAAEGSGVIVKKASTTASLAFLDGAWTLREGDMKLAKTLRDGTRASHRFCVTPTGDLVLRSKKGADAEKPVAYYRFEIPSPVQTIASQPASLGSSAQATQVDFYSSGPLDWNVSFNYPIVDFSTDKLEGVQVSSYGPVTTVDNRVFKFSVTPSGASACSVSVPEDAFHDSLGNLAPWKAGYEVINDPFPPSVLVNRGSPRVGPASHVVPWTLTFSKPVTNFGPSLLGKTYNVASFGPVSTSDAGATYHFNVAAAVTGKVRVHVLPGTFKDLAGNYAPEDLGNECDVTVGSPAALSSAASIASPFTNASPIPWRIEFNEYMSNVSDATLARLVTTPNVASVLLVSSSPGNTVFTLDVHVTGAAGDVRVDVPANVFLNSGGVLSSYLLEGSTARYDATPLSATTRSPVARANKPPVPWTITFSREVESLPMAALSLSGCTFGSVATTDNVTFHLSLLPSGSPATVSCSLLGNRVRDLYGNYLPDTLAETSVAFYSGGPRVVRLGPRLDGRLYSRASPIPWELVLDNEVNVATMPDASVFALLTATNVASFKNLTRPDGDYKKFHFDVFPNGASIPNAGRVVNVSVSANKFFDLYGNGVVATAGESITYDPTPPVASISFARMYSKVPTTTWTVTFDEPVLGFDTAFLSAAHNVSQFGPVTNSGNSYSFPVTAAAEGHYRVELLPGKVSDYAGNYAAGHLSAPAYYDHTPPQPLGNTYDVAEFPTGRTNTSSPILWHVTFGEEIIDFDAGRLQLSPGISSATCPASVGLSFYVTLTLATGFSHGDLYVNVPANTFSDRSGNQNSSALPSPILLFDRRPLTCSSTAAPSVPANTNAAVVQWVIAFSRSVRNFEPAMSSGLSLVGCSVVGYTASSDSRVFTLELKPTLTRTPVSATVVPGFFYDLYGNASQGSGVPVAIEYYGVAPACTYLGPKAPRAYTNAALIPWKIAFDLPVVSAGLLEALSTEGAKELTNVQTVDGKVFFFDLVPDSENAPSSGITVRVSLPPNSVSDLGGNYAAAFLGSSIVFDNVAPSATIVCLDGSPAQNYPQTQWRITFDSDVASFSLDHLGNAHNVKSFESLRVIDMSTFEFKVNADKAGHVNVALLPGVVPDRSGNFVPEAIGTPILYDPDDPLVLTLGPTVPSPTNRTSIPWALTFDKKITNFTTEGLSTQNVSLITGAWASGDSKSFAFDVHPLSGGLVTVEVPESTFWDETESYASKATSSALYDPMPPTSTIRPRRAISNSATMTWDLTFSEPVADFYVQDLSFSNTASQELTKVSPTVYTVSTIAVSMADISVAVPANTVFDVAGNAALPSYAYYSYRTVAPSVVHLRPALSGARYVDAALYTNRNPIRWELVLDGEIDAAMEPDLFTLLTGTNVLSFQNISRPDRDYKTFCFDVVPDASSSAPRASTVVGVSIDHGKLFDPYGNAVAATAGESVTYDTTPPTAAVGFERAYFSTPTVTCTVSFDKPVFDFYTSYLSGSSNVAQFGSVSVSGNSYSFPVTPSSEGFLYVELLPSTAADYAGNFAARVLSDGAYYDNTPPQPLVNEYDKSLYPTGHTNSPIILWHLEFRETIVDFSTEALQKSAGISSITNTSAASGTSFDLHVALAEDFYSGDVSVVVPASAFSDPSGNRNALPLESAPLSFERRPLSSSSVSGVLTPTNANPIPWVVSFSRPVSDFGLGWVAGISVSGCSMTGYSPSSDLCSYTLGLVPTSTRSTVSAKVLGGYFHDLHGNVALASDDPLPVEYYGEGARCTELGPVDKSLVYTNFTLIRWKIVFDLPVDTTALLGSLTTVGVSQLKDLNTLDGKIITFDVVPFIVSIPSSGLTVQVSVSSNSVLDFVGNYASPFSGSSVVFDNVPSVATITPSASLSNLATMTWTLAFSKAVAGFSVSELAFTNATSQELRKTATTEYSVTTTAVSQGDVVVEISEGKLFDLAGNAVPAVSGRYTYDSIAPSVVRLSPLLGGASRTRLSPIPWELAFDDNVDVSSLSETAFFSLLTGTNVLSFLNLTRPEANYKRFQWHVVPNAVSIPNTGWVVSVDIQAQRIFDSLGNGVLAATGDSVIYDPTPPIATISFRTEYSSVPTAEWTVSFDKPVVSFDTSCLSRAYNVSDFGTVTVSGNSYSFLVTAAAEGPYQVELLPSKVADYAGNYAAGVLSPEAYYDNSPPQPLANTYDTSLYPDGRSNSSPIAWRLEFREAIVDFDPSVLQKSAGISGITTTSGTSGASFDLRVNLAADFTNGDVSVLVPANAFSDPSGNRNSLPLASSILSFDRRPVTCTSAAAASVTSPTNAGVIQWVVTFSRTIVDFDSQKASGLSLASCSLIDYAASPDSTTFTLNLVPSSSRSSVSASVVAGKFRDIFGNAATASGAAFPVEYYKIGGACTSLGPTSGVSITNLSLIGWTIVFDHAVDTTTLLGSLGKVGISELRSLQTADGRTVTFDVVPNATNLPVSGRTVQVNVPSNAVRLADGSYASPFTGSSVVFDTVASVAAILPTRTASNSASMAWALSFSKPVADFTRSVLQITNASATSFSKISSTSYSVYTTASASGTVTVGVTSNTIFDLAGNSVSASSASYTYDVTAPFLVTNGPTPTVVNASLVSWSITFSESMNSFDATALSITGCSIVGTITPSSDNKTFTFNVAPSYTAVTTTPASFTGLIQWFDAYDIPSGTYDSASKLLNRWNDKSGSTRNATSPTTLQRPKYLIDASGRPAVEFNTSTNGTARILTFPSFSNGYTQMTLMLVFYKYNATHMSQLFSTSDWTTGDMHVNVGAMIRDVTALIDFTPSLTSSAVNTLFLRANYDTGLRTTVNGTASFTSFTSTSSFCNVTTFSIGGYLAETARTLVGNIREIAMYNGVLNNADMASLDAYVKSKWAKNTFGVGIKESSVTDRAGNYLPVQAVRQIEYVPSSLVKTY